MTAIDLDAIRARAEKATPGPWTKGKRGDAVTAPTDPSPLVGESRPFMRVMVDGPAWAENADFIAHAREDVPALLAEIDRLLALVPEPAEDERETLGAIRTAQAKAMTEGDHVLADQLDAAARYVIATRRPVPSREQVEEAIEQALHDEAMVETRGFADGEPEDWVSEPAHLISGVLSNAVLALFEKGAEARREATHDHKPVQHRDGKEPWCKVCGLNRNHEEPHSRLGRATPGGDS